VVSFPRSKIGYGFAFTTNGVEVELQFPRVVTKVYVPDILEVNILFVAPEIGIPSLFH